MRKFFSQTFSRDEINTGRQIELDITKTICIFFMVVLHFYEEFAIAATETSGTFANFLTYFLAGFTGAGTFMLCMGIGFGYTKHSEPIDFIKRGALILLFSYILNIVRSIALIFFFNNPNYPGPGITYMLIYLLQVDIMQFAGLALMCFGLFKLAKLKPWVMLLIATVLSLGGTFISMFAGEFSTGSYAVDAILSLFIPIYFAGTDNVVSYFPLMNYLIFPIAGYCSSFYYKRLKNKKIFFGLMLGLAAITITAYCLINPAKNQAGIFREGDIGYYHIYTWDAYVNIITSTGLIGLTYFISLILPKFILNGCHNISKNINKIYCISWVITLNGVYIFNLIRLHNGHFGPIENINDLLGIAIGLGIFIISAVIAHYYVIAKQKIKDKRKPTEVSTQ